MIYVKIENGKIIPVVGAMRLDVQLKISDSAIVTDTGTNEKIEIIKDQFGNLKLKDNSDDFFIYCLNINGEERYVKTPSKEKMEKNLMFIFGNKERTKEILASAKLITQKENIKIDIDMTYPDTELSDGICVD